MQKEKKIRTYTRKTKTGKTVTVRAHTAKYDAAEEARKAFAKKAGAGEELSEVKKERVAPAANDDLGFTAEDYKAWYHWDTEADPKNASALKVKKALIAKMGRSAYNKYEKQMTDSYSARGHLKGFKGIGDKMKTEQEVTKRQKEGKFGSLSATPENAGKIYKQLTNPRNNVSFTKGKKSGTTVEWSDESDPKKKPDKKMLADTKKRADEMMAKMYGPSWQNLVKNGVSAGPAEPGAKRKVAEKESASTKGSTMTKEKAERAFEKFCDKNDALLDRVYAAKDKYGKDSKQYKSAEAKQKAFFKSWQTTEEAQFLKRSRPTPPPVSFLRGAMGYSKEEAEKMHAKMSGKSSTPKKEAADATKKSSSAKSSKPSTAKEPKSLSVESSFTARDDGAKHEFRFKKEGAFYKLQVKAKRADGTEYWTATKPTAWGSIKPKSGIGKAMASRNLEYNKLGKGFSIMDSADVKHRNEVASAKTIQDKWALLDKWYRRGEIGVHSSDMRKLRASAKTGFSQKEKQVINKMFKVFSV